MSTEPRALWRWEREEEVFPRTARYVIKTAYYSPDDDEDVAACWNEETAEEIVRLHNEYVVRRLGGV